MKQAASHAHDIGWQSWSYAGKSNYHPRNTAPFGKTMQFPTHTVRKKSTPPPTGWCSWYGFGTRINERTILDHASYIAKRVLPLKYILIDDGWTTWGDWTTTDTKKFPRGMKYVAKQITSYGLQPALWIAPFLVESHAKIFYKHPSWFIRTKRGSLVEGTKFSIFDSFLPRRRWILDMSNSQVQAHLKTVIQRIIEQWGFTYLKLDFLYAQHFHPAFRSSEEPDRLLQDFLLWIKTTYPHVYISACGCPLAPAVGVVDAMRISADITFPHLHNMWPIHKLFSTYSLAQLKHNLRYRNHTNVYWHLDPDVFLCHPKHGFSHKQITTLRTLIIQAKGLIFLGDNLLELTEQHFSQHINPLLSTIASPFRR
jgi:alpha-galactosidase